MTMPQQVLRGALLIVASEFMFATMGAAVKAASAGLSNEMLVFLRNLLGLVVLLPWLWRAGSVGLHTRIFHVHVARALLGLAAMYCFFYALSHLTLADAMLLKMTAPFFMPLVAYVWMREGVTPLAVLAVPVGFVGVALVLKPGEAFGHAAWIGLLGGVLAAAAQVTVRRLGYDEPPVRTVVYFTALSLLVSALPLVFAWQTPSGREWALVGVVGLTGTAGQWLLTRGYSIAAPGRVGPFAYFSVIFAAVYGYLLWDERLDWHFWAGAACIGAAGALALRGHYRRGVKAENEGV